MWHTLKNREFSIFTFSQTISQFGDKLDYIALIGIIGLFPQWRTPFLLSQLIIFMTLPVLIFGPIAGVLVDRWHKKKVMVVCDALRMICAAMIPIMFLVTGNIYPVFAVVFVMFLLALFFNAARSAIIPNLVSREKILPANSIISFVGRCATFLGMLVGGFVVDWNMWQSLLGMAGWTVAFIIDAITFGISALMLSLMKVTLVEHIRRERRLEAKGFLLLIRSGLTKVFVELKHAVRLILKEKNLGFVMATILLIIIAGSVIYVLVIPTVQQDNAWGTRGVGTLAAVGAIGLLAGAYLVGVFGHYFNLKTLILECFVLIGGALVVFPFLVHFWQFALVVLIGGVLVSPVFIGQDTLIHRHADDVMRGRIFSIRDWIFGCLMALGALFIGFLATLMPKSILFVAFGIILVMLALVGWFIFNRGKGTTVS